MQKSLMGGCLAAAAWALLANPAFAFQQPGERIIIQPNAERQAPPDAQRREAEPSTHTGQFAAQGEGAFRMTIDGENAHTHKVTEQTQVTINGRQARLEDLRQGDQIRVTMGANNVALKVEANREDQPEGQARPERQADRPREPERREARFRGDSNAEQGGKAWLGVLLRETDENQQGVHVAQIYPSGPAARAGLFSGDVLIQINDKRVSSPDEAARLLEEARPNEQVELLVLRGEERQTLTATLGDRRMFFGEEPRARPDFNENERESGRGSMVPDHAMMLEQHRRFAEQHQRLEEKLDQVLKELEELRSQMGGQRREAVPPANRRP